VFHEEGRILYTLARRWGGTVLEIGSDLGISTRYLYEGLERGFVVAVDYCHKWGFDKAWPRRIRIEADSRQLGLAEELRQFGPYALAFIDGDHRYAGVVNDIAIARALGIPRILFHDTRADMPAPAGTSDGSEARRAVQDCLGDWDLTDLTTGCGMILAEAP
jgi:hypothetical protein